VNLPQPYILGLVVCASELCLTLTRRSRPDAASRDRKSLALIWLVNLASIGLGVLLAFTLPAWALPWSDRLYVLGFCLFVPGLVLRWFSIIYLGRSFTANVAIAADHQLIDSGPYRLIRHPSYTGALLILLGFGLCVGNLASLLVIFVPIFIVCLWRMRIEEQALIEAFGERYRLYMQRTKRLVPFVY
jgi:protein-S-isoprenylcysteine O-methyltransferase